MSIDQPNTTTSDRITAIVDFEPDNVLFSQSRPDTTLPVGLAVQAVINGYLNIIIIVRTSDINLQFTDGLSLMKSSVGSVVKKLVRSKLETVFDGTFVVGYHSHLPKPHNVVKGDTGAMGPIGEPGPRGGAVLWGGGGCRKT